MVPEWSRIEPENEPEVTQHGPKLTTWSPEAARKKVEATVTALREAGLVVHDEYDGTPDDGGGFELLGWRLESGAGILRPTKPRIWRACCSCFA